MTVWTEEHHHHQQQQQRYLASQGLHNNGWDDEHYDYILEKEEVLLGRYVVKNRIGKGERAAWRGVWCGGRRMSEQ